MTSSQESPKEKQECSGFELFFSRKQNQTGNDEEEGKGVIENLFHTASSGDEDDSTNCEPAIDTSKGATLSEVIVTRRDFSSLDGTVKVLLEEQKEKGIAHQLWPAAEFLCRVFEKCFSSQYFVHSVALSSSKTNATTCREAEADQAYGTIRELLLSNRVLKVIELGAGVGLCGIFLSTLLLKHDRPGHHIIMTDLPEAMSGLEANIKLNGLESTVNAQILIWGNEGNCAEVMERLGHSLESPLVIAADCVYWECLYVPLVNTLTSLIKAGCTVLIAHVRRWKKDGKFFTMCKKRGWVVQTLLEELQHVIDDATGEYRRHVTRLYCIHR